MILKHNYFRILSKLLPSPVTGPDLQLELEELPVAGELLAEEAARRHEVRGPGHGLQPHHLLVRVEDGPVRDGDPLLLRGPVLQPARELGLDRG